MFDWLFKGGMFQNQKKDKNKNDEEKKTEVKTGPKAEKETDEKEKENIDYEIQTKGLIKYCIEQSGDYPNKLQILPEVIKKWHNYLNPSASSSYLSVEQQAEMLNKCMYNMLNDDKVNIKNISGASIDFLQNLHYILESFESQSLSDNVEEKLDKENLEEIRGLVLRLKKDLTC